MVRIQQKKEHQDTRPYDYIYIAKSTKVDANPVSPVKVLI